MRHLAAYSTGPFVLFLSFIFANVALDVFFVKKTKGTALLRHPPTEHYTFVDQDFPPHIPLKGVEKSVKLLLEDTVRYGLTEAETTLEWAYTGAVGDSNIRLGPDHRFFNTGFSYQLHCARFLVSAFQKDPPADRGDREHVSRCLNVIRQSVLCSADTTLEPADTMSRNLTTVRVGGERTCRNWPALYRIMEQNWVQWKLFQGTLSEE